MPVSQQKMATISLTDQGTLVKIGGTTTITQQELDDENISVVEHIEDVDNCIDVDFEGPASLDGMSSPFHSTTTRQDGLRKQDPTTTTTTTTTTTVNSHYGYNNPLWTAEQRYVLFFWPNKYRARNPYAHFIPGARENSAPAVYAFLQRLCSETEVEDIDQRLRAIKEEVNERRRGGGNGLMCRGVRGVFGEWEEKEETEDEEDGDDWDVMEVEEEEVVDEEVYATMT